MTKNTDKLEKLLNLAFHPGTGEIEAGVAFNKARKVYHEALQEKQEVNISVHHKQAARTEQTKPKQEQPEEAFHTKTLTITNILRWKVDAYMVFMLDTAANLNMFVHIEPAQGLGPRLDQATLRVTMNGTLQAIERFEALLHGFVRKQNAAPAPQPPPPPPEPEPKVDEFKNNAQVIANWIFIFFIAFVFIGLPLLMR